MAEDKEEGDKEEEVYDEEGREELVEGGEISSEEAGFMKGYEDADEKDEKEEKEKEKKEDEEEETEE